MGGYFLVSDAHFDARSVALDGRFQLLKVYDMQKQLLVSKGLEECFMTTEGQKISKEQVEISMKKPKASRGFKLLREDTFYVFKRIK